LTLEGYENVYSERASMDETTEMLEWETEQTSIMGDSMLLSTIE